MKAIIFLMLTVSMLLLFPSCASRQSNDAPLEDPSSIHRTDFPSTEETASVCSLSEQIHSDSSAAGTLPPQSGETAVFSLKAFGIDEQTMKMGDTIGDWTLTDLQISYFKDTNEIKMLESLFSGKVTLKGTISRNNLLDDGYDFLIAEEDQGKIPKYISSEAEKDVSMFMLDIPEGFENKPKLDHGQQMKCKITVSSYKYIFAHMTAPNSATLVSIEELPNTGVDITDFIIVGYDYEPGDLKYQIELTEEQKEKLETLLEADKWTLLEAEDRPQYGLNSVLQAIGNDRHLSVYEFDSYNCIIAIVIDGKTSTYWAPSQVAEESKSFMERLRSE